MTTPTHGWACVTGDLILVKTVSPTRRAAIVNFLVTERSMMIYAHHTDDDIARAWAKYHGRSEVVEVTISVAPQKEET
jgi:hypothetical protein